MLVIHRSSYASRRYENAVQITDHRGYSWRVDPGNESYRATGGIVLNRQGCIVSFADGLVSAGHEVLISTPGRFSTPMIERHRNSHPTILVFFIIGLAWGRGQWDEMRTSLCRSVSDRMLRFRIMEHTGSHYLRQYFGAYEKIEWRLP